jgi:tetratricopeptide (TPR) repeat protein
VPFKLPKQSSPCPDDPESLFRDLRRRKVPGLLSHQADLLRSYMAVHTVHSDIALQLPTGSGKTLVGLLIAEWRRRKYGERVVYLCPTRQLVNQVSEQAGAEYGIDLHAFTGSRKTYHAKASADWQNAEAIAVTNYSSLFNTNPFFSEPDLIILDDAHSAENYISSFWSLEIDRHSTGHESAFAALCNLLLEVLPHADRSRLADTSRQPNAQWVEKIPTPAFHALLPELVPLLDEHTKGDKALQHRWSVLRESLHACHMYVAQKSIHIRPLLPPSNSHLPFSSAEQRLYMSATLGAGGDLERVTGRHPIFKIPVPTGWDKQGIGRRFFIFPKRSLEDGEADKFVHEAVKLGGRALYLVPDEPAAKEVRQAITDEMGLPVFDAKQLEASKQPFVTTSSAVAVIANRYDGIDLKDDDCRLLMTDGLPGGANLQEKFLVQRVTAQLLLDDRILTRLVQGFGRCTRSPNDYAAVIILGESLNSYLFNKHHREFFHPEIQAELEFGLEQSKEATAEGMLDNLKHFFNRDAEWEQADQAILSLRATLHHRKLDAADDLASAVEHEHAYQYSIWNSDFVSAIEHCRAVLGKLAHPDLKGYRALWLYLAGSAAWLANQHHQMNDPETAKNYFRKAQAAAPVLRWLIGLGLSHPGVPIIPSDQADYGATAIVERLEMMLDRLGTVHDRKFDHEEHEILSAILQDTDGVRFEEGHKRLGQLLGYDAGNSSADAAPDPWWIADDTICLVFEDHAEGKKDTVFPPRKARQAASHPDWLRANLSLPEDMEIVPIVITPCIFASRSALPFLKRVRYWSRADFRTWAKDALRAVRDVRRTFPGMGNMEWRAAAITRLKAANVTPAELNLLLSESAADAMNPVDSEDEEE